MTAAATSRGLQPLPPAPASNLRSGSGTANSKTVFG